MPIVVLIPGADGRAWYWHRLVPQLAERGHDVVTMDMPTEESAGLAEYTQAVVDAIGDRRGDIVVVAQSIGGFVGPLVCERVATRLLILVNAMVPAPGETAGEWWDNTGQPAARAADAPRVGRDPDAEFDVARDFFHDVPADVTAEAFAAPPSSPSSKFFADPWPLPAWPAVPTRFLQGREDRFFPVDFQRRVARERLGIDIQEIPGGHLNALSEPGPLAAAIDAEISGLSGDA
jgi:pimeloyl-ACP methyl ester carboxylesterase